MTGNTFETYEAENVLIWNLFSVLCLSHLSRRPNMHRLVRSAAFLYAP